jgi:hypothetical protein
MVYYGISMEVQMTVRLESGTVGMTGPVEVSQVVMVAYVNENNCPSFETGKVVEVLDETIDSCQ